jgi:hypothetical protein
MNCPRPVCGTLSVAQTGTMVFKMPVPNPLINRAGKQSGSVPGLTLNGNTYQKSSKHGSVQNIADSLPKLPTQHLAQ